MTALAGFPLRSATRRAFIPLRAPSWSVGSSLNEEGLQYRATTFLNHPLSWFIAVWPPPSELFGVEANHLVRKELFHVSHGKGKREDYRNSGTECISKPQESWLWGGSEIQIDTGTPSDGKSFPDHFWCPNSDCLHGEWEVVMSRTQTQEPHSQSWGFHFSAACVWSGFLCQVTS